MKNKKSLNSKVKKKDGLSVANLISLLGLALLAFFLYLGFSYGGTNTGSSVLYAVLITVGIGILLYSLIYAKRVENNFQKWRIAEYTLLMIYVGACVATIPLMSHFLNVNNDSRNLQQYAISDLNDLDNAMSEFQNFERNNLSQMHTNLKNVAASTNYHAATTPELREFISNEIIGNDNDPLTEENINSFIEKWDRYITDIHHYGEQKSYGSALKKAIAENRNRVEAWKIMEIPEAIQGINQLHWEMADTLKGISKSYPLHKIGRVGSKYDIVQKHLPFVISTKSQFKEQCDAKSGVAMGGIIISIIIFLLVLFNYLVAYRSNKVAIKSGGLSNDGGMVLKD